MSSYKILSNEDIKFFQDSYAKIYQQSIDIGLPESKRFEFVRNTLDKVLEKSIQGSINEGCSFSKKELKNMYDEFYRLLSRLEAKAGIN